MRTYSICLSLTCFIYYLQGSYRMLQKVKFPTFFFKFFKFWLHWVACGILGLNLYLLQWKLGVLTTGPPEKSPVSFFFKGWIIFHCVYFFPLFFFFFDVDQFKTYLFCFSYLFVRSFTYVWLHRTACATWVPQPRIEPMPPAVEAQSLNR